jgi:hypothetical protein
VFTVYCLQAQKPVWPAIDKEKAKKEVALIAQWYGAHHHFKMDMIHAIYEQANDPETAEESKGYFIQQGNEYCSMIGGIKSIQNNKLAFTIDTAEEIISVQDKTDILNNNTQLSANEQYLERCQKVEFLENKWAKHIRFIFPEGQTIKYTEITYQHGGFMTDLIVQYNKLSDSDEGLDILRPAKNKDGSPNITIKEPKLVIKYFNCMESYVDKLNSFSHSPYFSINHKQSIVAQAAYDHYEIIDNRQRQ